MGLVDLPAFEMPAVTPRLRPTLMVDGPCAGRWENIPQNIAENWVLVSKDRNSVEGQMHACYRRAIDGRWLYTGITVTTDELYAALARAKAAGITHGESYGA